MKLEQFKEIANKYGLVKKENGEYTLPGIYPADFIMRMCRNGCVEMADEISFLKRFSPTDEYKFEFCNCREMEDYRVELKLKYLIESYKLLNERFKLEQIKKDF